jgi:hypothetical protein
MRWPVATEPVKNTPSIFCASKAAPTSPAPTRQTITSRAHRPRAAGGRSPGPSCVAYSDGLYSTALPVSSAGTMTLQPTNQG